MVFLSKLYLNNETHFYSDSINNEMREWHVALRRFVIMSVTLGRF